MLFSSTSASRMVSVTSSQTEVMLTGWQAFSAMGVSAPSGPNRSEKMSSQSTSTAAPTDSVSTTASTAASSAFRKNPRGR